MAKRIVGRNSPKIKNAHLIGAGNKFNPVYTNKGVINYRASVIKQSGKHSVPPMPKTTTKKNISKVSTSFKLANKSYQINQPQQKTIKAKDMTVRLTGLQKMKSKIAKSTPSPIIKQQKVKTAKKSPNKGR
jgi:hypothetical protein